MAWSQDEERMLAQIEQHLVDDDPRLVARLESFNDRARRSEERSASGRESRRSTAIIVISWFLIAVLVATLLILVLREGVATALALSA